MIKTFGMIVFNEKGEVLLVRHEKGAGHITGVYGLLVGRPEEGEMPIETAIREAEEEAGVRVSKGELVELPHEYSADISREDGSVKDFSMHLFIKNKYDGHIRAGNEETTPQWVTEEKLDSLDLLPNVKRAILDAKGLLVL